MNSVVGVDLSLTATGLARVWAGGAAVSTVVSKGQRADSLTQRDARLELIADTVLAACRTRAEPVALVVVEGPAITRQGGSNWDRAGLWWRVVSGLLSAGHAVAVMTPTSVKSFAAGKGNADKAAVAVGMARLWPDIECDNDNEWDALALATAGAQWLGWDVPRRAHHERALAKVEWPQRRDAAA